MQCVDNYDPKTANETNGKSTVVEYTVKVIDEPSAPKDLTLVPAAGVTLVERNVYVKQLVGTVTAIDGDELVIDPPTTDMKFVVDNKVGTKHTFSVESVSCGARSPSGLTCTGNLFLQGELNFEEDLENLGKTAVDITVTDSTNLFRKMTVKVACDNVNDPVTGFRLVMKVENIDTAVTGFEEKPAPNAPIGFIEILDEDVGQEHTILMPLPDGNPLGAFQISTVSPSRRRAVTTQQLQVKDASVFDFLVNPELFYKLQIAEITQIGVPGLPGTNIFDGTLTITDRPITFTRGAVPLKDDAEQYSILDTRVNFNNFDAPGVDVSFAITSDGVFSVGTETTGTDG